MTVVGVIAHRAKTLGDGLGALRETLARRGVDEPLWREIDDFEQIPGAVSELTGAGVELLFVWGGDGTVQRCLDALRGERVAVAILPAGTANLFAANLGIPTDLEEAVSIGLHGRRRSLDLGMVNGERFGVMAGVGFDAVMIDKADAGIKDRFGRLAYVATGIGSVGRPATPTRIEIDGAPWFDGPCTCVLVGNMGDVLGGLSAFPEARPDDGRLDVGVVTADSAVDWARTLARTIAGAPAASPFVHTVTAARIDVTLAESLPYELDGDARPDSRHLRFRVLPGAVSVCVSEIEEEQ